MKRFTLFLALCLTMIGTALAQTLPFEVSSAPVDGVWPAEGMHWYTIKNGNGNYLKGNATISENNIAKLKLDSSADDIHAVWCIVGDEANGYKFYNYKTKTFISMTNTGTNENSANNNTYAHLTDAEIAEEICNFELVQSFLNNKSGYWCIKAKGSNYSFWNQNEQASKKLTFWYTNQAIWGWGKNESNGTGDNGSGFQFTEVDPSADYLTVTYEYYINGKETVYTTRTVEEVQKNTAPAAPAVDYVTINSYDVATVGQNNGTVKVNCSENLPFVVTTDMNNPKYYGLKMHSNQVHALGYNSTDNTIKHDVLSNYGNATTFNQDDMWWYITGNLVDGFKLYNKAADTKSLSYASGDPQFSDTNADNTWSLHKSGANPEWYCFAKPDNNYMNLDLRDGINKVTFYDQKDAGSSMYFVQPADIAVTQALKDGSKDALVNAVGNYAYMKNDANRIAAQAAIAASQAEPLNMEKAKTAADIHTAMIATEQNTFGTGYYRIYSAQPGLFTNNKGIYFNGSKFVWGSIDNQTVEHILKVENGEKADAKPYVVYTCNHKKYMQGVGGASGNAKNSNKDGYFELVALEGGIQQKIVFGNGTVHALGHNNGAGAGSDLTGYDGGANSASAWYLVPATDIEVALHTVDGASYASVYLPFPVQSDGVTKLYTGVIDGNQLNMTEQTGVVPAEKGYVLCNTSAAATTTLTIGSEAGSISGSNDLQGTLTGITFGDRGSYLVLGQGNTSNGIGFFTPADAMASIGKNKAYLNASSVGSESAIALNFDDVTTGISLTEVNGENAPVYDLSGRRVQRTVKGGLYIQNGKKYIVK